MSPNLLTVPARIASVLTAMVLAAILVLGTVLPARALADGDPASDVLLGENVFYPYSPAVSPALQNTLNNETAAAAKAHFPLKVALIASPVDLGVIPSLFGAPQKYAAFLDQEISFQTKQPLLVVMATGFGVESVGPAATREAASLPKPSGSTSNALAQAAVTAIAKLATASGHSIAGVAGAPGSSGGSSGSSTILVALLAVAAVATAAALITVTVRRRSDAGRDANPTGAGRP